MGEEKKIVYQERPREASKSGVKRMTEREIFDKLLDNPDLQVTSKATNGKSRVDINQEDTYTDAQKEKFKNTPNYHSNIANVKTKGREEVVILSKNKDADNEEKNGRSK